jgi:hypothetical protein
LKLIFVQKGKNKEGGKKEPQNIQKQKVGKETRKEATKGAGGNLKTRD